MTAPQISAIICTHNREEYLGAAIDSLLNQDFPAAETPGPETYLFELIVVDNASTDRTREIVEARLTDPRLKYIYEPTVGLSVARNTGANQAAAPILAYLDDDAVATPQWLTVLQQAFAENDQLAIAGGKVTLIWPEGVEPPLWMSPELASPLGYYDLGSEVISITDPRLTPRGLNYAIRRQFLDQVGGFDVNLGRVGKNLLSNEELQMTERALQLGWQVAYLPEALVAHNVAPERMQRSWFFRRSWWQGISQYYREQLAAQDGLPQLVAGGERLFRGLYKWVKYSRNPAQSFDNLVYAYGQLGYLSAALKGVLLKPVRAK